MRTINAPKRRAQAQSTRERIANAARRLFNAKGFSATTTAEVAIEAEVSIGLIYRYFSSKDELILACIEQNVQENIAQRDVIFEAVERGELSVFGALKAIAFARLVDPEIGLFYELLAESFRSQPVKKRVGTLAEMYRRGIRDLAVLAKPDASPDRIEAYVDLIIACFIGLCYRPAIGIAENPEKISDEIACLLMTTLGLTEQPERGVVSKSAPRSAPKRRRG